jgi:hypothetical protein
VVCYDQPLDRDQTRAITGAERSGPSRGETQQLQDTTLADVNTFAFLGIDVVFEKHPYFDVVPVAEYDLQKDVLNAVLTAFERKAGERCSVSMMWQTFIIQQVRSSTVEGWNGP